MIYGRRRTLCSTHASQLLDAKPCDLERGREGACLLLRVETAQGYPPRLR